MLPSENPTFAPESLHETRRPLRPRAEQRRSLVTQATERYSLEDTQRLVQELLNNVMKHATGATGAQVHVVHENHRLEVSVEDNGCGFVPAALATQLLAGIGLSGVRNRVDGQTIVLGQRRTAVNYNTAHTAHGRNTAAAEARYECPMGCAGSQSTKPGKCSTCEMELKKKS